ncbi:MAG: peptidoglycan editing factor PgeF [Thiothrix sp.]|uniref:peptidoglycan editing factor PgeF n=1 Tax=Thiothrix sp. TaxID=1032 RepID=UPI00261C7771|nr:peptidoglycan editing factor PgeF [Thiothrix sp.]MDD5391991.1 peptidoglycan editing factor PgeF [Thiothrix sp.]
MVESVNPHWLTPEWPAPANVRAVCTTRQGGVSVAPFASLNLGDHVGDDPYAVARNRMIVGDVLRLPTEPLWLQQVHGVDVCGMDVGTCYPTGDASVALRKNQVCVVMTADCLPVLFCNKAGTRVAAAHAGWRGLQAGVLEQTLAKLDCPPTEVLAWLGPAIGPQAFEVGAEVCEAFMQHDPAAQAAFQPSANAGKWLADIYLLARQRLAAAGVSAISGGDLCTYTDAQRFFSYRRDGQTGRMACLIWMDA